AQIIKLKNIINNYVNTPNSAINVHDDNFVKYLKNIHEIVLKKYKVQCKTIHVNKEVLLEKSFLPIELPMLPVQYNLTNDLLQSDIAKVINFSNSSESWLNDSAIDFYFKLFSSNKVYSFPAVFYNKIKNSQGRYMPRNFNIFDYEYVFFPVMENNHWILFYWCNNKLHFYNSLGNFSSDAACNIKNFIKGQFIAANRKCNIETVTISYPVQSNSYDCGVFITQYALFLIKNRPINFKQYHCKYFRYKMAVELVQNKLLDHL
ncbi:MAG: Ulp1 family isopeptidase, partial [Alphaproteobacteria bacterium]|nr:Ulp1 family isopeptidase [Alphaproteobacteria bacterium]